MGHRTERGKGEESATTTISNTLDISFARGMATWRRPSKHPSQCSAFTCPNQYAASMALWVPRIIKFPCNNDTSNDVRATF